MAWGDQSDYWWLKPVAPAQVSQAMQFGAQLRQQAIGNALKQKDLELENQRTGIQIQEYFSKKELEMYKMAGTAALAQKMSGFRDMTDPSIPETIYGELAKSPMLAPIAERFLDDHRNALQFKLRQDELKELRLSREQIALDALKLRGDQYQFQRDSATRKLDMLGAHYENQDEAAKLKLEMQSLDKEQNQTYRAERLRQIDEQADRLGEQANLRKAQFEERLTHLTPEKRDLLKRDMDRLDVRAEAGDFRVKTSRGAFGTGIFADTEKYGPKYHEERKKLLDSYGVSSGVKADESSVDVMMFDTQGNKVRVPRARMGEFGNKGYRMAQ